MIRLRRRKAVLLYLCILIAGMAHAAKAPGWYAQPDALYPQEHYITALGEGRSEQEARDNAVSQISLYFHTSTEVYNDLVRKYSEIDGSQYSFSSEVSVEERAQIRSQAEFFGIQFTEAYASKKKVHVLAYINRNDAFAVYEQDIRRNAAVMEHLLAYAEDGSNPVTGFDAAKQACGIADITAERIKEARIVKNVARGHFARAEMLISRSYAALKECRENMVFTLNVRNDYNGQVAATLASLLEERGYAVAQGDEGRTVLDVAISVQEDEKPAGFFLYTGISISGSGADGKPYFSYSRAMPKKGAPTKADAYRRAYLSLAQELRSSFINEFDERIQITYK